MSDIYRILAVNPGSTSTKVGLFENEKLVVEKKLAHSTEEISKFKSIIDQVDFRRSVIDEFLKENQVNPQELSAVVGRGGLLKPLKSGTYRVSQPMIEDLKSCKYGEHASNMGALIAYSFHKAFGIPAFIVDPVVVDEMQDIARYSGIKEISRTSVWHALNVFSVVRQTCNNLKMDIDKENFVVAHIGGGVTVSAIQQGRCIDVSNGLEEGPFTPERAGSLPTLELVKLCFSGKYTQAEIKKMLVGKGGLVSYLGTSNMQEVAEKINQGDSYADEVFSAMGYQIAKTIGSYVAVLKGKVTRIILTGGGAHNKVLLSKITDYIESFAPVHIVPGEDELLALAQGGLRVLRNETTPREYSA
ncbi:MAG: butyrate kinase [Candidatus Rifleibacteriota bacterium]